MAFSGKAIKIMLIGVVTATSNSLYNELKSHVQAFDIPSTRPSRCKPRDMIDMKALKFDPDQDKVSVSAADRHRNKFYILITPVEYDKRFSDLSITGKTQMEMLKNKIENLIKDNIFYPEDESKSPIFSQFITSAEESAMKTCRYLEGKFGSGQDGDGLDEGMIIQDTQLSESFSHPVDPPDAETVSYYKSLQPYNTYNCEQAYQHHVNRKRHLKEDDERTELVLMVVGPNILRYIVTRLQQFPTGAWNRLGQPCHGSFTMFHIAGNGQAYLHVYADALTYPPPLRTEMNKYEM